MNTRGFKDNFSKQSDIYVKYRPQYPRELYAYLASLTAERESAWDCGTGNGQAAIGLAAFYNKVIATDPSEQQIKNCLPHEQVKYVVEKAEQTSIDSNSVDLITVANALHWFDFESFYKEARRVLKRNGVIAVWAYAQPIISPAVDTIVRHIHDDILGPYWLAENQLVQDAYVNIPFPFQQIRAPQFFCEKKMNLDDFIGYLNTWSATQRFINKNNFNLLDKLGDELHAAWGSDEQKTIRWKLILKVGRV
jgi:ubiquinone/menaquinone biosynthesis C-methylase UbiE